MKRLKQIVLGGCVALLIVLSANVTNACLSSWVAEDGSGTALCRLYSQTATSCFYACTCWGDCTNIYKAAGAKALT